MEHHFEWFGLFILQNAFLGGIHNKVANKTWLKKHKNLSIAAEASTITRALARMTNLAIEWLSFMVLDPNVHFLSQVVCLICSSSFISTYCWILQTLQKHILKHDHEKQLWIAFSSRYFTVISGQTIRYQLLAH